MFTSKPLYIASKIGTKNDIYGNEISYFSEPIKYIDINYMPLSCQVDYQKYGTLVDNMLVAYVNMKEYQSLIKGEDMAYMIDSQTSDVDYIANLDKNDQYCTNANYRVKYTQLQCFRIKVVFEKIVKGGKTND